MHKRKGHSNNEDYKTFVYYLPFPPKIIITFKRKIQVTAFDIHASKGIIFNGFKH